MRVRVVVLELEDVADRRAAERVDGLVGVADDAQLGGRHRHVGRVVGRCPAADQLLDQLVLRVVGVLVLVDEDVPEPAPVVLGDVREGLQQVDRRHDQVVEVERVGLPQPALVRV